MPQVIKTKWRIYVSVNEVSIDSDNGLLLVWCWYIINGDLFSREQIAKKVISMQYFT